MHDGCAEFKEALAVMGPIREGGGTQHQESETLETCETFCGESCGHIQ